MEGFCGLFLETAFVVVCLVVFSHYLLGPTIQGSSLYPNALNPLLLPILVHL
jgi:hypothetical protein